MEMRRANRSSGAVRSGAVAVLALLLVLGGPPGGLARQAPGTPALGADCGAPETAGPAAGRPATGTDVDLIGASRRGDAAAVGVLLEGGANVHAWDEGGQTALIAAAWGNHLDAARRLIEAGADVNAQDDTQQSAFLIATSEGYLELLRVTLAAGADVRRVDSFRGTGLIRAAERGHADVVAELLGTDIAVDHVNRLGLTALLEAIVFGEGGPRHTETVRLLVGAGADPNLADAGGVTPLAHARRLGYGEIAAILEEAGGR